MYQVLIVSTVIHYHQVSSSSLIANFKTKEEAEIAIKNLRTESDEFNMYTGTRLYMK